MNYKKVSTVAIRDRSSLSRRIYFIFITTVSLWILACCSSTVKQVLFAAPAIENKVFSKLNGVEYPDWLAEARVYGLSVKELKLDPVQMEIDLNSAVQAGANVIEADSRLSDYISEEDFVTELQLIRDTTEYIHKRGLKVVWYIPSLEVITPNGRHRKDSFARVHPDWVQLSFDREHRAVFYGQKVFWVEPNDESAWMCPNSPYREWFKARLQRLAETGVDGIWLDVPLFGLVAGKWGCADSYCREKFEFQTGLEFPKRFNVNDKRFWRYVKWRHETLTEFVEDCQNAMQLGNPDTVAIAEVVALDHIGAVEWGTEGSSMVNNFVVWEQDAISEATGMTDASYNDWMAQYNSYKYFRGATMNRPSWAFCYGYDDSDAQLVMAGAVAAQNNPYELRTPKMTNSVGMEFRGMMYNWIADFSKQIFRSKSIAPVAVLHSERNRDFLDTLHTGGMVIESSGPTRGRRWLGSKAGSPLNQEYMGDYRGLSILLYQHQIPTDIYPFSRVNEEILKKYKVIVLPYMATLSEIEKDMLLQVVMNGSTLIVSGPKPGMWNADGSKRKKSLWADILGGEKDNLVTRTVGQGRICFWKNHVGRKYLKTHNKKITTPLLSWLKDAGVEPWVNEKLPVVVQPYVYEQQVVIHVLNYSWIGKLGNQPNRLPLELSIPWDFSQNVGKIVQSEPQWDATKTLSFSERGGKMVIPLEVGINCILVINLK